MLNLVQLVKDRFLPLRIQITESRNSDACSQIDILFTVNISQNRTFMLPPDKSSCRHLRSSEAPSEWSAVHVRPE